MGKWNPVKFNEGILELETRSDHPSHREGWAQLYIVETGGGEQTATFYFDEYDLSEVWIDDPPNMVDGNESTYARTYSNGDVQALTGNTATEQSGEITKVEIRALGRVWWGSANDDVYLRPVFDAGDGDNHTFDLPGTVGWSEWFDITEDTNAPDPWTWDDVIGLKCDVEDHQVGSLDYVGIYKVEIRVTYSGYAKLYLCNSTGTIHEIAFV